MLSIRVSPKLLSTRVIYQGQSEAALSTGGSPKQRYLPGAVRSRVIYPVGLSEAALSTVTVCDLGLIWGHQHR